MVVVVVVVGVVVVVVVVVVGVVVVVVGVVVVVVVVVLGFVVVVVAAMVVVVGLTVVVWGDVEFVGRVEVDADSALGRVGAGELVAEGVKEAPDGAVESGPAGLNAVIRSEADPGGPKARAPSAAPTDVVAFSCSSGANAKAVGVRTIDVGFLVERVLGTQTVRRTLMTRRVVPEPRTLVRRTLRRCPAMNLSGRVFEAILHEVRFAAVALRSKVAMADSVRLMAEMATVTAAIVARRDREEWDV